MFLRDVFFKYRFLIQTQIICFTTYIFTWKPGPTLLLFNIIATYIKAHMIAHDHLPNAIPIEIWRLIAAGPSWWRLRSAERQDVSVSERAMYNYWAIRQGFPSHITRWDLAHDEPRVTSIVVKQNETLTQQTTPFVLDCISIVGERFNWESLM